MDGLLYEIHQMVKVGAPMVANVSHDEKRLLEIAQDETQSYCNRQAAKAFLCLRNRKDEDAIFHASYSVGYAAIKGKAYNRQQILEKTVGEIRARLNQIRLDNARKLLEQ